MIQIFCLFGYFTSMFMFMFDNLKTPEQINMLFMVPLAVFYYGFYGSTQLDLADG